MLLSKVEVRNRRGESLVMSLEDVDNGFGIAEIEGLDPTKATLVSSGIAGKDGAMFHSSKRESRNIKLKIELIPDFDTTSAKSLRTQLYHFLMPKTEVTLRFFDDLGSYVDVVGRVESFDAPLFTKDPVADISVMCFDPDFFDPNPFTTLGLSVTGSNTTMTTVPYLGSVESGILFTTIIDRPITTLDIVQQTPNGDTYKLSFAYPLVSGDKLVISTIPGAKGVSLTRDNTVSSLLRGLSPQSKWIELEGPGDNLIRVSTSEAGIPWNIQYVNRHGGL